MFWPFKKKEKPKRIAYVIPINKELDWWTFVFIRDESKWQGRLDNFSGTYEQCYTACKKYVDTGESNLDMTDAVCLREG